MIQKFLDMMRNDPKAHALVKGIPVPKNDQEAAESYVKIAKELGFDLTADEILTGLKDMEQARPLLSPRRLRMTANEQGCTAWKRAVHLFSGGRKPPEKRHPACIYT